MWTITSFGWKAAMISPVLFSYRGGKKTLESHLGAMAVNLELVSFESHVDDWDDLKTIPIGYEHERTRIIPRNGTTLTFQTQQRDCKIPVKGCEALVRTKWVGIPRLCSSSFYPESTSRYETKNLWQSAWGKWVLRIVSTKSARGNPIRILCRAFKNFHPIMLCR